MKAKDLIKQSRRKLPKIDARAVESAMRDLRGQCMDEAAEFTPEQYEYLLERMREDMKNGPLVLTGRKGRAAD